ncbi:MAG: 50S ribosomal protein L21 [Desulfovibrionaceae bacterium]
MYAIVQTGGKQIKVEEGKKIFVEKLDGDVGTEVILEHVLMVGGSSLTVGSPYVDGAKVFAEILEQGKCKKVVIFKKKRRQGYRRKQGHRQLFTALKIKSIQS